MTITINIEDLINYAIIGMIAGTLAAALLLSRRADRNNLGMNTLIGMIGAVIGQFIFGLFGIELSGLFAEGLDIRISLGAIAVAFVGALLLIALLKSIQRR